MPIAHLIHGFLGAGKTTFSRELATRLGAVRYSPDELMVERHGHDPPASHFDEYLDAVYAELDLRWPAMLANGADVVLDFGFWTRRGRDEARKRATAARAKSTLYWVRCSERIARQRCRDRNRDPRGSLIVTDDTFDVLKLRFQPLGPDEPFELVDTG